MWHTMRFGVLGCERDTALLARPRAKYSIAYNHCYVKSLMQQWQSLRAIATLHNLKAPFFRVVLADDFGAGLEGYGPGACRY